MFRGDDIEAVGEFPEVHAAPNMAAPFDVYLDRTDTLHVYVKGYEVDDVENIFGIFDDNGYKSAERLFKEITHFGAALPPSIACEAGDNDNLGGAVFDVGALDTSVVGDHFIVAAEVKPALDKDGSLSSKFKVDFSVLYIPFPPQVALEGQIGGNPSSPLASGTTLDFGKVCIGGLKSASIFIKNQGEATLNITTPMVEGPLAGTDYLLQPESPISISGNSRGGFTTLFRPSKAPLGTATGTLTFRTNDECQPSFNFPLKAEVVNLGGGADIAGSDEQVFTVPHDGNPSTTEASITLDDSGSASANFKVLDYSWYELLLGGGENLVGGGSGSTGTDADAAPHEGPWDLRIQAPGDL